MTNNKNLLNKTYNFTSYAYDEIKKKKGQTVFEKADRELLIRENNSTFDKYNKFYMFDFIIVGKSGKEATYKYDDKNNCFYKYAGGDFNQYVVFANEEDKNDFYNTLSKLENDFYNNIVIDENQKFHFSLNFSNCGTYASCKEFTEAMRLKLLKEINFSILQYDDVSKSIEKASKEKDGLTYNELKEVVINAHNRYYEKLAKVYEVREKEPSVAELRASGNDCLADMKELDEMINRSNFGEVRDY